MRGGFRCCRCGEVIGVYEPLVAVVDGRARETSRALEPDTAGRVGDCYHRACYQRPDEDGLSPVDRVPPGRAT
jgi:hypothetical protein